ncbi:class III lanthipeptide [Streptomyces angustmyceticus]
MYLTVHMSTDPRKGGVEMSIMDLQGLEVPGERDAQALGSTISGGC